MLCAHTVHKRNKLYIYIIIIIIIFLFLSFFYYFIIHYLHTTYTLFLWIILKDQNLEVACIQLGIVNNFFIQRWREYSFSLPSLELCFSCSPFLVKYYDCSPFFLICEICMHVLYLKAMITSLLLKTHDTTRKWTSFYGWVFGMGACEA